MKRPGPAGAFFLIIGVLRRRLRHPCIRSVVDGPGYARASPVSPSTMRPGCRASAAAPTTRHDARISTRDPGPASETCLDDDVAVALRARASASDAVQAQRHRRTRQHAARPPRQERRLPRAARRNAPVFAGAFA